MDFSYYNNNNEKVRLNIEVDSNWDSLNIQNKQLNSIFSKIDDGDRKVSEDELTWLNRLFKKADGILSKGSDNKTRLLNKLKELIEDENQFDYLKWNISIKKELSNEEVYEFLKNNSTYKGLLENKELLEILKGNAANGVLENEELDELLKQLDKGEIKLPTKQIAKIPENYYGSGYIEIQHSTIQLSEIKEDSEKFYQAEEDKIKKNLLEKYPEGEYELEVRYNGRGYEYKVYCTDCDKPSSDDAKILSQGINIIRADGIEVGFKDRYQGEITDDDSVDYSKNHQSASWGTFTITDKNGNTHKIEYRMQNCWDKDILDCRRTLKTIADFIAKLPEETINKLIENNVESIEFSNDYDDPFLADKNYFRNKMDSEGNVIDITDYGMATIISPTFVAPKREYKKEQNITRDDGYNINIVDTENNSAKMTITLPNNKQVSIDIEGTNYDTEGDKFHQWQIPKLVDMLKSLPESVLEDLTNEISGIKFMTENGGGNGIYTPGSNVIAFKADYEDDTPIISFVHELGHAIDNQNSTMISKDSEFTNKFEEFKTLLSKFVSVTVNHAMAMPEEFFASTYAYLQLPNDNCKNNWIADIENKMDGFKDSDNPDKVKCYQLFEELKSDVSNFVDQTRNKTSQQRADNSISSLVKQECGELINKFKDSYVNLDMVGESAEIEIIQALSSDDKGFDGFIKIWEEYANDKVYRFDNHIPTPKEVQELFAELIEKAQELRARIKQ